MYEGCIVFMKDAFERRYIYLICFSAICTEVDNILNTINSLYTSFSLIHFMCVICNTNPFLLCFEDILIQYWKLKKKINPFAPIVWQWILPPLNWTTSSIFSRGNVKILFWTMPVTLLRYNMVFIHCLYLSMLWKTGLLLVTLKIQNNDEEISFQRQGWNLTTSSIPFGCNQQ